MHVTTPPTRPSRLAAGAAVGGLLLYGALLVRYSYYSVGGADTAGYANAARGLLARQIVEPVAGLDDLAMPDQFVHLFTPLGNEPGPRPRTMVPTYPVGLPLHLAAGALLAGWRVGPFLVSPLAAVLSLALIYLVGREFGLGRGLAIAGGAMLAANPTFFLYALQPMSDGPAACWSLLTIWAALRSRRRDAWGLGAGAAFGVAALVRPTSLLLLAPLLFALRPAPKVMLLFLLGGGPAAGVFCAYNTAAYGNPLLTGYLATNHQGLFGGGYFPARFRHYLYWLTATMSPLPLVGWLGVALDRHVYLRDRALLVSWFGVFFVFYCCYYHYNEWWYTRFLLPGMPALFLGALLTVRDLAKLSKLSLLSKLAGLAGRRGVWLRRAAAAVLIVVVLGFERQSGEEFRLLRVGALEMVHAESCRWADGEMVGAAPVVAMEMSGALKYYANRPVVRYDRVEPGQWRELTARAAGKGYRWYALLMPHEVEPARSRLAGRWTQLGAMRNISLWRIEPD